jgi:hypothetical protein
VGGASAVLSRNVRAAAFAVLAAGVGCYYAWSTSLWSASTWWDVAWVSLVVVPAVFAFVYLALPLRRFSATLPAGLAAVLVTWGLEAAGQDALANFGKLAAATLLGFWFIRLFETLGLVVFVACLIPWIDAYSVWRGPTSNIVSNHPGVFTSLSFALPIPGESDAARLGPPDLLFFALFLAAAARFRLRVGATWVALALSFGATLAIAVGADISGLPALPGLSLGFLVVNTDLLRPTFRRGWEALRGGRDSRTDP